MSDVMLYGALRFKFNRDFSSVNELYNFVKQFLGEAIEIEYKREWTGIEWVATDEIEFFNYKEHKGNYNIVHDYHSDVYYLDYLLITPHESLDDVDFSILLSELNDIKSKTVEKFLNNVSEDCKVKFFEWYTGCDMPVDF